MPVDGTCSSGGRFLRRACGRDAVGVCVYCGEPFCGDHGTLHHNFYEVCHRRTCVAKFADVQAHHLWIQAHANANSTAMCAHDGCQERMQHSCQRCRLRFCDEHLLDRTVTEYGREGTVRVVQLLCPYCASRRPLWD